MITMAIMRNKDIRKLEKKEEKLSELRLELAKERANINIGASVSSPGRIKEMRKTIARILTMNKEKKHA